MDITEKDRIDENGKKVESSLTEEQFCILYAVCHVTGMLSACANPVIYGYLNENFNREFKEIFDRLRQCCFHFKMSRVQQEQQGHSNPFHQATIEAGNENGEGVKFEMKAIKKKKKVKNNRFNDNENGKCRKVEDGDPTDAAEQENLLCGNQV